MNESTSIKLRKRNKKRFLSKLYVTFVPKERKRATTMIDSHEKPGQLWLTRAAPSSLNRWDGSCGRCDCWELPYTSLWWWDYSCGRRDWWIWWAGHLAGTIMEILPFAYFEETVRLPCKPKKVAAWPSELAWRVTQSSEPIRRQSVRISA